jgi:hypothetical protein
MALTFSGKQLTNLQIFGWKFSKEMDTNKTKVFNVGKVLRTNGSCHKK